MTHIGIDLGGTKIEAALLDAAGVLLQRQRVATPQGDYAGTLDAMVSLVVAIEQQHGVTASVGVGIPGTLSPDHGRVKNANSVCLIGHDLAADLAMRLARPVAIGNDADCFALSEAQDGAAAGFGVVQGVILGTGVGSGIVVQGRLLQGPNRIAGEWGHNPLPWISEADVPGRPCYCGLRDCIETFLSGPGLAHTYCAQHGVDATPQAIADGCRRGEPAAQATMALYHDQLARGLAHVINVLDPDCIVLGGGLSNVDSLYHAVPQRWERYVFSDKVNTRLVRNRYGDSSGVRGAAWLGKALASAQKPA